MALSDAAIKASKLGHCSARHFAAAFTMAGTLRSSFCWQGPYRMSRLYRECAWWTKLWSTKRSAEWGTVCYRNLLRSLHRRPFPTSNATLRPKASIEDAKRNQLS